jgi:hypothetical protein
MNKEFIQWLEEQEYGYYWRYNSWAMYICNRDNTKGEGYKIKLDKPHNSYEPKLY